MVSTEDEGMERVWYEQLTGLKFFDEEGGVEKPEGAVFGFECGSFVLDE